MIPILLMALAVSGSVPSALTSVVRVAWIDAATADTVGCALTDPGRWQCDGLSESPHGVVVIIGNGELAYQCVAVCAVEERPAVHKWGRLIVLEAGGVAPDDLNNVQLSAWKPGRSAVRTLARRFVPVEDSAVEITPLSSVALWISGDAIDPDSFISINGPAIGSTQVRVATVAEGPPDTPLFVTVASPYSLTGRVQTRTGLDVGGADVEIFEPLVPIDAQLRVGMDSASMILHSATQSAADGSFRFDRLAPGFYLIAVTDATRGRGTLRINSLLDPVLVRLEEPVRVAGRVLRHQLPVPAARVRFVPNADVFAASTDPRELMAEEAVTDQDGRFVLTLPAQVTGVLQVLGPDGTSVRVPVARSGSAREIQLGDVMLPDRRSLTVRVLDNVSCAFSAAGPLGSLGLTIVQATAAGTVHWFDIPEPGDWALNADCDGESYTPVPSIVTVRPTGPESVVDVRVVRRRSNP